MMGLQTFVTDSLRINAGETYAGLPVVLQGSATSPAEIAHISGRLQITSTDQLFIFGLDGRANNEPHSVLVDTGGQIIVRGEYPQAIAVGYYGDSPYSPTFSNKGTIDVHGFTSTGIDSYAISSNYLNYGTIISSGGGNSFGVRLQFPDRTGGFQNFGSIEVRDEGTNTPNSVIGVQLGNYSFWFRNEAGAKITAVNLTDHGSQTVGAQLYTNGSSAQINETYYNAGLIQGDTALRFTQNYDGSSTLHWRTFTNADTGVLSGKVVLIGSGLDLVNAGLISGSVILGSGDQIYDGRTGGRVTGMVSGGDGQDALYGGLGFDNFQGNQGNDTESGGAGDDWVVGGKDDDQLSGDDGDDVINGNLGNDSCHGGAGADTVRGGQGDDSLSGGAGNDWLFGDRGNDTISGGAGADTFNTFGDAGVDRVTDFNAAEGDRVHVEAGTQYSNAQVGADTVVAMTGGGQLILVGVSAANQPAGWIFT